MSFNLYLREFDRAYIENDWCIGPDDGMYEVRAGHAVDVASLLQLLADWNVGFNEFTYENRSDYPV